MKPSNLAIFSEDIFKYWPDTRVVTIVALCF